MQKINVLESRVFNRIAAGEVVERPASIVKELVENSIDAGAKNITIEIVGGGIKNIKISDNGCGIYFDDLKNAFMPHATSKIKEVDDLDGIETLGFRGEALASIGSVAEVTLISKTAESETGGKIEIHGGNISEPSEIGSANGTYISVENLFFNTPARAKFLKKPKTEETEITNLVTRFILANPTIQFRYIVEGKQVFISNGSGKENALFAVYGRETLNQSLALEFDFGSLKISGYIGKPTFSKPNKTYQTLIINGRYVINSTVASAVHNAYSDFLMKRQYPFYILYLNIDYKSVDVNVHPNKLDVRFENNGLIYSKVFESVNRTIYNLDQISKLENTNISSTKATTVALNENSIYRNQFVISQSESNKPKNMFSTQVNTNNESKFETTEKQKVDYNIDENHNIFTAMTILNNGENNLRDSFVAGSKLFKNLNNKYEHKSEIDELNPPRLIGEVFNTYLLLEYQNNMVLVDQHAAHERILYDKFMIELENKKISSQVLLAPFVLNVNYVESEFLSSQLEMLENMGFEIMPFGNLTYKVSAVPFVFADINLRKFFDLVLSDIKNSRIISKSELFKDQVAQHACKSAVKGGDKLSQSEIFTLFSNLGKEKIALTCPHGRPIVIRIDKSEIEKWFKRIV